ncbi:uncharacterized protein LOC136094479 [Hydra vulgaris]|uniref:uncharacterized protein LOC136094479 n=1 Tax=Hydra vulgaris TaxID=6087 RepID=UPI0032EA2EBB
MSNSINNHSTKYIVETLNISQSAVRNCIRNHQEGIKFATKGERHKQTIKNKNLLFSEIENTLFNTIAINNELTQNEMLSLVTEEQNSPANIEKRAIYARRISHISSDKLVFLDESGLNQHLRRRYGYSQKNEKAYSIVSRNRNTNRSLMCAINISGVVAYELRTGANNAESFEIFIRNNLFNYFRQNPDHILIMDNVPFLRSRSIIEVLNELRINREYLPAWSPKLNPIEEFFSMIKARYCGIKALNNEINIRDALEIIFNRMREINEELSGFWRSMERWLEKSKQNMIFE